MQRRHLHKSGGRSNQWTQRLETYTLWRHPSSDGCAATRGWGGLRCPPAWLQTLPPPGGWGPAMSMSLMAFSSEGRPVSVPARLPPVGHDPARGGEGARHGEMMRSRTPPAASGGRWVRTPPPPMKQSLNSGGGGILRPHPATRFHRHPHPGQGGGGRPPSPRWRRRRPGVRTSAWPPGTPARPRGGRSTPPPPQPVAPRPNPPSRAQRRSLGTEGQKEGLGGGVRVDQLLGSTPPMGEIPGAITQPRNVRAGGCWAPHPLAPKASAPLLPPRRSEGEGGGGRPGRSPRGV